MNYAFADGGVYKNNPSKKGGAWAYVILNSVGLLESKYGIVEGNVTNNLMEFIALYEVIKSLPEGWSGEIVSDSKITLGRIFYGWKCNGLPEDLVKDCRNQLKRLGIVFPRHVKGHQAQSDDIYITYNRMCDFLCRKAMKEKWENKK